MLVRQGYQLKDVCDLDKESVMLLGCGAKLHEVPKLMKIKAKHNLTLEQTIALTDKYDLTLDQVKIPNFSLALARALRMGFNFNELQKLTPVQIELLITDEWRSAPGSQITINDVIGRPHLTLLHRWFCDSLDQSLNNNEINELLDLSGVQLLGLFAGISEKDLSQGATLTIPPVILSKWGKNIVSSHDKKVDLDSTVIGDTATAAASSVTTPNQVKSSLATSIVSTRMMSSTATATAAAVSAKPVYQTEKDTNTNKP